MKCGVEVGAAIADDRNPVIGVGSLDKSGKNDAAGRDAVKNQCIDVIRAKNHGEIRAGEGTDSMLGYNDLIVLRCDDIRYRSEWFLEEPLMLLRGFDGTEQCVSGTDLGEPWSKTYLAVDDGHAGSTSMIENTRDSSQKSVFGFPGVNRNNAGLTIHAQDGCVGRIERKHIGHNQGLRRALPVRIVIQCGISPAMSTKYVAWLRFHLSLHVDVSRRPFIRNR